MINLLAPAMGFWAFLLQGCVTHRLNVDPVGVRGRLLSPAGWVASNDPAEVVGWGPLGLVGYPPLTIKNTVGESLLYFCTDTSGIFRAFVYFPEQDATLTFDTRVAYRLSTDEEQWFKLALDEKIQLGMPESWLYLSWGRPHDINKSIGPWGVHKQLVFRVYGTTYWPAGNSSVNYNVYNDHYVYIENGVVSSWQD